MIFSCTCNRRVTSSLETPEDQESSNSCKSCGGILSVDKLGGLSRRMWSALGPEYSRVIDPQLKWKISSNVKPRALRRARTFAQDNRKKFIVKNAKDSEDLFDKDSKKKGDMLVSESEKLGVSILGRRFSDNLEIVPIKKRRFSLPSSPSPPNLSPSYDFSDQNHESRLSLFLNNKVSVKQDEPSIKHSCRVNWDREGGSADEKRSLDELDEQICDSADFSGISILAAAACDSSVETLVDEEGPGVRGHPSEENPVLVKVSEPLRRDTGYLISYDPELGEIKANSSVVSFATLEALSRESGKIKSTESKRENSVSSLRNSQSKWKSTPSRDDRLHWDLNTVMDAWETQPDNFSNSVPHDTPIPVAVCNDGNCGLPQTEVCGPLPEDCQYMDAKVTVETTTMKTNLTDNGEKSCLVSSDVYPVEGLAELASGLSTETADVPKEEKCETKVDTHNNLPHLVIPGNASVGRTTNYCGPGPLAEDKKVNNTLHDESTSIPDNASVGRTTNDCGPGPLAEDKKVNNTLHDESTSIGTVDSFSGHSAECDPAYARWNKNNPLKSPNFEKHQSLSTDDIAPVVTTQSSASELVKDTCGMIIHGNDEKTFQAQIDRSNSKNITSEGCLSDEAAYNEEFGNCHASTNQSESFVFNPQGTSDHVQLPSRSALIQKYERITADVKVNDSYNLSGESSNTNKSASLVHICLKLTNLNSEGMVQDTCIPSVDDALNSHGTCNAPANGQMRSPGKISLEEHYDSEYHSDASPIEPDLASGMEKVEFLGDDDSQYEDGELRESVLNSWGEDGAEEVETEHVDYGSEETEFFKTGSDFGSQYDLAVGNMECRHEGQLISTSIDEVSNSKCYLRRSLKKDVSNANYSEGDVGLDMLKDSRENHNLMDAIEVSARDENRLLASAISADVSDVLGRSSQPAHSRMKSSGWDKLPIGEFATVNWNYNDASLAPSVSGESARRTGVSSVRMDSSSRVERSMSSEGSCRKEVFYARESRKHDRIDLNAQRNSDASRSLGRSRLSFSSHGRGRGEHWVGSPDHHENSHYDTSSYYSSASFAHNGSRNAAAAAVAKVESNGFVVAPDGTIVKAGCMGSGNHLSGRPSKSSSHLPSTRGSTMEGDGAYSMPSGLSNSREVSPDRHFNVGRGRVRYSSGVVSLGQRNRYHGPMPDNRIDSLSLEHPLSRRQRSFSPHKRPTHLSHEHTRSQSRSRTRSPHAWASPRGRNDGRINGVPNARRESRSPQNVKSQRRLLRERSPQRRAIPGEELAGYVPLSRNHSLPLHASRWIDGKRNLQDHLQEHQHRFPTERSPPARIFSQSNRIDHIDSRGRMKPDEYYRQMNSGRFRECAGYGRESKHDGYDDGRRGKSSRYEMLNPEGHFENNGNLKCLHYDDDGFRTRNPQPKPSGFQQRGRESLRAFDRGIDAQHGNSPRRIKEEMAHFRLGRDGKPNSDFKSFGVRDTIIDMSLQRRPS